MLYKCRNYLSKHCNNVWLEQEGCFYSFREKKLSKQGNQGTAFVFSSASRNHTPALYSKGISYCNNLFASSVRASTCPSLELGENGLHWDIWRKVVSKQVGPGLRFICIYNLNMYGFVCIYILNSIFQKIFWLISPGRTVSNSELSPCVDSGGRVLKLVPWSKQVARLTNFFASLIS